MRSKAQWFEEGEKNTQYFLNLEKRNYNSTCIKTLITDNNTEITDLNEIILEQKRFYENLYSSKINNTNGGVDGFTFGENIPKLTNEEQLQCEAEITLQECAKALQKLPNGKSPGADGFTTDFYKFFWIDIRDSLYECYIDSFKDKTLSQFQKLGVLSLLPKIDKDLRFLANWRPVSLLSTGYKILTKLLAMRLQNVIKSIINPDQVGYIQGRYIGENVRIMYDIIQYADLEDLEAYITQVDFEKVFDSVKWGFLFRALEAFNFGEYFRTWIKILYSDISACVGNNGHFSNYFKLTRSIRQGCPISALLFLLVVELLAIRIRNDEDIKGVQIDGTEYKINLMADDATLTLLDIPSIVKAMVIFDEFKEVSGLKVNLSKTEIIPIGIVSNTNPVLPREIIDIKIKHGPFKALGIWYTLIEHEQKSLNFDKRLKTMQSLMNIWRTRSLSLKGKILIAKTLLLPQIQFLFNMLAVSQATLRKIDEMLFDFLWNGKPHKIKRNTIIAPVEHGGLGMIDVYSVHKAAKCSWVNRLFSTEYAKWKVIFLKLACVEKSYFNHNINPNPNCKSDFHKQILEIWAEVFCADVTTPKDIANQYILHNKFIKVDNKPIQKNILGIHNMVNNIKIIDIIDRNGFKAIQTVNQTCNVRLNILNYNSIKSAIPKKWKTTLVNDANLTPDYKLDNNIPYIRFSNCSKPITKVTSKDIYIHLLIDKIEQPTSVEKWTNIYPFLENFDWKDFYKIPFIYTTEPYLQSFQYKIINRILNTNEKLFTWKISNTNQCRTCSVVDTIEHHLYYCRNSRVIWDGLQTWLNDKFRFNFKLTVCEVIFGLPHISNINTHIVNFLLILTKWYINKNKTMEKDLKFLELLRIFKSKIDLQILSNTMKDRENKDWQNVLSDAL